MESTGIHEGNNGQDASTFTGEFGETFGPNDDGPQTTEEESEVNHDWDLDELGHLTGIIAVLRSLDKAHDDEGKEVELTADIKAEIEEPLSRACVSYKRVGKTLYQVCKAIFDLHETSSPYRLFRFTLGIGRIPERTAYLYLRIYKAFADNLAAYALGVRKLGVMSGLEDTLAFLEQHGIKALVDMTSGDVTKLVDAATGTKRNTGSQPRVARRYGSFKFSEAANGKSFSVHCKDAAELRKVMDLVESHLKGLTDPTNGPSANESESHTEEPNTPEPEETATNSEDNENLHVEDDESQPASEDASLDETDDVSASKPSQVNLIRTHPDGRESASTLSGDDVPDMEDWEEFADELYDEAERAGEPFMTIRMERLSTGKSYLGRLTFDGEIKE
jgi:hypothetical protein